MSLSIAFQNAISGLRATQAALEVTAGNVANSNTEGYSRKVIPLQSQVIGGTGKGVTIGQITRNVDDALLREIQGQISSRAQLETEDAYYARMQDMFGSPSQNRTISDRLADLISSAEALANAPETITQRADFLAAAVAVSRTLNDMAASIQKFRGEADRDIAQTVDLVNSKATIISNLNIEISRSQATGQSSAALEDKRDSAINELADLIDITTFKRASGEIVVLTAGGGLLADRFGSPLSHSPASFIDTTISHAGGGIDGIDLAGSDLTNEIRSGRLTGLVRMRDEVLPNLASELDELASRLQEQVNRAHNPGVGIDPPNTLTGTTINGGGAATALAGTGTVRIAVIDADDAFAGTPLDLDLTTVATVGGLIAAINAGLAGLATASLNAQNQLVLTATNAADGVAINELTSDVGGRGFSNAFGLNDLFVSNGSTSTARGLTVRSDLLSSPGRVTSGRLDDIAAGSVVANQTRAISKGDNLAALEIAGALSAEVSFGAAGGLPATTRSLVGYGADIISGNANAANTAKTELSWQEALVDSLTYRAGSISGVNLDEEFANLVTLQTAYTASARVMTTIQQMFAILEEIVR